MLQVKNSNSPKGVLTALAVSLLTVLTVFYAGCKDKNAEPVDPYTTPGNVENPNWQVTVENNLTSSMTFIVRVSFTDQPGTLAAFMGSDCGGVAECDTETGLYLLYISPATEQGGDVRLRFYSPLHKRIFEATETFPYRNDDTSTSVAEPYTPSWTVAN